MCIADIAHGNAGPSAGQLQPVFQCMAMQRPVLATYSQSFICMAMQGPLLANYSQSFIEQLRQASSPYAYSTMGTKRRLSFEDKSRLQRFLVWLQLTVKKRMPWGAAAVQRRRRLMVSSPPRGSSQNVPWALLKTLFCLFETKLPFVSIGMTALCLIWLTPVLRCKHNPDFASECC